MVSSLFNSILLKGVRSGQIPARTQQSRDWFREQAKRATGATGEKVIKEADKAQYKTQITIGKMYLFSYDAKHKKTLPYFDRSPLIFPISRVKGMMSGLNFHYLPLKQRAILMDALYEIANNDRFDETTKLKVSYDVLSGASRFKWFAPTIHNYLRSQLRSRFIEIPPTDWDTAIFLPLSKFEGASSRTVWADSRKKMS